MRRGEVAKVMYHLKDFGDVCALFRSYAHRLRVKAQVRGWVGGGRVVREEARVGGGRLPAIGQAASTHVVLRCSRAVPLAAAARRRGRSQPGRHRGAVHPDHRNLQPAPGRECSAARPLACPTAEPANCGGWGVSVRVCPYHSCT